MGEATEYTVKEISGQFASTPLRVDHLGTPLGLDWSTLKARQEDAQAGLSDDVQPEDPMAEDPT